jgi:hypothetical protein
METHLLNLKAVLANEAFPKGSPRPDYFKHAEQIQTQAGLPAYYQAGLPVSLPLFSFLVDLEN